MQYIVLHVAICHVGCYYVSALVMFLRLVKILMVLLLKTWCQHTQLWYRAQTQLAHRRQQDQCPVYCDGQQQLNHNLVHVHLRGNFLKVLSLDVPDVVMPRWVARAAVQQLDGLLMGMVGLCSGMASAVAG